MIKGKSIQLNERYMALKPDKGNRVVLTDKVHCHNAMKQ